MPKLLKDDTCIVPGRSSCRTWCGLGYQYPVHWARRLSRPISRALRFRLRFPAALHPILSRLYGSRSLTRMDETKQIAQSVREDAEAGKFAATAEMGGAGSRVYMTGLSPEMHRNIFRGKSLGESITGRTAGYNPRWKLQGFVCW